MKHILKFYTIKYLVGGSKEKIYRIDTTTSDNPVAWLIDKWGKDIEIIEVI